MWVQETVGFGVVLGIMVVERILFRGLERERQSRIIYRWVVFEMMLKFLQSFSLYLGTYSTCRLSAFND